MSPNLYFTRVPCLTHSRNEEIKKLPKECNDREDGIDLFQFQSYDGRMEEWGDFYGVRTIILAHILLNDPMQNEDTKITLPYRKKLEQCLADVEKAVVQKSSDSGGSLVFDCFNSLDLSLKVARLYYAKASYILALSESGGRRRCGRPGGPAGVRTPCRPCRDPVHLKLGEEFCGCGILTDDGGGAEGGKNVEHYWLVSESVPCHACGEGCLMPRDWALEYIDKM
ncbi:hypothetical protein CPB85DRAFT_1254189 [Mucidula mucida]|nr:hypothetical protein CPB85DRAFT_1254189 [Mucidula mucida]